MTRGYEETKISQEWRKLRGEAAHRRMGKQKGGKRNRLGEATERGHLIPHCLHTVGCSTDYTSNLQISAREQVPLATPSTPIRPGRRASPHRFASFEPAAAPPTPAMLSIMLPPLTMPVVAIRNFRPHKQVGKTVLTNDQQMTNYLVRL